MHEFMMPLFARREHLPLFPVCPFWGCFRQWAHLSGLGRETCQVFPQGVETGLREGEHITVLLLNGHQNSLSY